MEDLTIYIKHTIELRAVVVPHDWGLRPQSVAVGKEFRLMFVTSTYRNATSSDISDDQPFVQGRAAPRRGGPTGIQSYSGQFRVPGSTSAVSACDNTRTNPNTCDDGA